MNVEFSRLGRPLLLKAGRIRTWIGVLLLLLAVAPFPSGADPKDALSEFASSGFEKTVLDQWTGMYFKDQKMGFSHTQIAEGEKGYLISSKAILKLGVENQVNELSFSEDIYLDKSLRPVGFTGLETLFGKSRFSRGVVGEKEIHMRVESTGDVLEKTLPIQGNFLPAGAISFYLYKTGLEVGKEFTFNVLLDEFMTFQEVQVKIVDRQTVPLDGKDMEAFRIRESVLNQTGYSFMAPDGYTLKETSLEGLEMRMEKEPEAVRFAGGVIPMTSLLSYSLIKPKDPIQNPDQVSYLKVRMSHLAETGELPSDSRQKTLSRIKSEQSDTSDSYSLILEVTRDGKEPPESGSSPPAAGDDFKKYLEGTIQIQPENPDIRKTAEEIVGGETDRLKAARKINRWVFENIKKEFVDTLSSVDTLQERRGECQSHSYLFTALARSVGIPTRVSSGIVYSEKYGGFLYHAWPEVYVGKWVAMDPTLGQDLADATHIKLVNDEPADLFNLLQFVGKVGLEVIDVKWN